jgi:segregation and condensation protein A
LSGGAGSSRTCWFTQEFQVTPGQEYNVKIDVFEGPLDLLLYLVAKAEVDITQISVSQIARQYMDYIGILQDLNLEVASEYLSMAATLTRLKAREVLGIENQDEIGEIDGEDILTRQQLVEKLLEYKKFKEAAGSLRVHESERFGCFARGKPEEADVLPDEQQVSLESISIFDLITAFKRILERVNQPGAGTGTIAPELIRLDDRIERVLSVLHDGAEVPFEMLFEDDMRKPVLIVTFMAVLELVRMRKITFRQETVFGIIYVRSLVDISDWNTNETAGEKNTEPAAQTPPQASASQADASTQESNTEQQTEKDSI